MDQLVKLSNLRRHLSEKEREESILIGRGSSNVQTSFNYSTAQPAQFRQMGSRGQNIETNLLGLLVNY